MFAPPKKFPEWLWTVFGTAKDDVKGFSEGRKALAACSLASRTSASFASETSKSSDEIEDAGRGEDATYSRVRFEAGGESPLAM